MDWQDFIDYTFACYGKTNGTSNSYIQATRIIDGLFLQHDVLGLNGASICDISDITLVSKIAIFIKEEEKKYKGHSPSFFDYINPNQTSYPRRGFCSAAINHYVRFLEYCEADHLVNAEKTGKAISKDLAQFFDITKEGKSVEAKVKVRVGQEYFRKMILHNYSSKCCLTGLNVPDLLRASHISPWAGDKQNRLNPQNGLCLSATYDAAFDKHLISFDDNYRMVVSKYIKDFYTAEVTREYFERFEGETIELPRLHLPDQKLLAKHRELMI